MVIVCWGLMVWVKSPHITLFYRLCSLLLGCLNPLVTRPSGGGIFAAIYTCKLWYMLEYLQAIVSTAVSASVINSQVLEKAQMELSIQFAGPREGAHGTFYTRLKYLIPNCNKAGIRPEL